MSAIKLCDKCKTNKPMPLIEAKGRRWLICADYSKIFNKANLEFYDETEFKRDNPFYDYERLPINRLRHTLRLLISCPYRRAV